MKTIKISILCVSILCGLTSCNKALDLEPITEQTEANFYRTEGEAFQALVAAYDLLQWDTFELYSEVMGDDCYGGGSNANDIPYMVRMAQSNSDPADPNIAIMWDKFYQGIFRTNKLLEKLEPIPFDNVSDKDRMRAELYFLRGYYFYGLARLFGNVPIITKTLEPSEYYTQKQATPQEVFVQIKHDMFQAIESGALPPHATLPTDQRGRVTQEAAQALMVRMWMFYTGLYGQSDLDGMTKTNAIDMIQSVIATSGCSLYDNFADNFDATMKNGVESLFEIQYSMETRWGDWGYLQGGDGNFAVIRWGIRNPAEESPYSTGWSFAPVRASLYTDYEDGDTRRDATLINMEVEKFDYTAGYQNTGIFNKKYTALKSNDPTAGGSRELNFPNNQVIMRYADVLLMAAELLLDSDISTAQNYYATVVKRAKGASYAVPTITMEGIRTERHLEFALEGIRYWDLLRYGLSYAKTVLERENSVVSDQSMQKNFDLARKGLQPIPQEEIVISKGVLKQNDGYL